MTITDAIKKLRNNAGWWEGDTNARRVLTELLESNQISLEPRVRVELNGPIENIPPEIPRHGFNPTPYSAFDDIRD